MVHTTSRADEDLAAILDYILADNPRAAEDVLQAIDRTMTLLDEHPGLGKHPDYLNEPCFADVCCRVVSKFPNYIIFYRPIAKGIQVLRIIHGARDLPTLFDDFS
tara:strand:+ start:1419 stop:1733 length:315 start_codon:yes stop_codon:yes gene_type:complete